MPIIAEILFIFNMWIGRIEIIPAMVLFRVYGIFSGDKMCKSFIGWELI